MKTLSTSLSMGALGALAVFISFSLQWITWVLFIAWVSYYIFGMSIKTSAKALLNISAGFIMGIIISTVANGLPEQLGRFTLPIAVFICISFLPYLSKNKVLNNIPAWFLGLIVFFGVHPPLAIQPILTIFSSLIAGFVFALLNHTTTNLISKISESQPNE
ncbi:DUF1097 domain-containing protein [Algoriphagus sp. AGSA1]|uniref:DUF1097 domain-containing protein n=1 Tax=Algoriphagus sp. AGSA1 TaxID=2907213 RepID=UPI001F2CCF80|nr:DUF1097 domain-containing protein [Algoriphagus sp. AGSA1]MCE7054258.1 DUF1097 domain-containing protein [Algoriphagus sp. AGSA1]